MFSHYLVQKGLNGHVIPRLFLSIFLSILVFTGLTMTQYTHADEWTHRKQITIDYTKVSNTNQSNFPVLISRTDANLKTVANGGHVAQADG